MLGRLGLQRRSDFMAALRSFFLNRGYLEVDTPVRLPVLLPEAHIAAFSSEGWWLHSSPELCMKRLLARGCDRLFQICHCFRKEECGRLHQSEFCMLEWYRTGADYFDLMAECEELFESLGPGLAHFSSLHTPGRLRWQDKDIDLAIVYHADIAVLIAAPLSHVCVTCSQGDRYMRLDAFEVRYAVENAKRERGGGDERGRDGRGGGDDD